MNDFEVFSIDFNERNATGELIWYEDDMKHYTVISPECSETEIITDDGMGPTEYFHCVVTVEAENSSKAKALAIKHKAFEPYMSDIWNDDNPFVGLKVIEGTCPHGICQCELCVEDGPTCPKCLAQFNAELEAHFKADIEEQLKAKTEV